MFTFFVSTNLHLKKMEYLQALKWVNDSKMYIRWITSITRIHTMNARKGWLIENHRLIYIILEQVWAILKNMPLCPIISFWHEKPCCIYVHRSLGHYVPLAKPLINIQELTVRIFSDNGILNKVLHFYY